MDVLYLMTNNDCFELSKIYRLKLDNSDNNIIAFKKEK